MIKSKQDMLPKYINIYRYMHFIEEKYNTILFDKNKAFQNIRDEWRKEIITANDHLRMINALSIESYKNIIID